MEETTKITHRQRDLIDQIMDNFNFENVHKTMVLLDWKWCTCNGIPTIEELRMSARKMMIDVIERNCYSVSSGGFKTEWKKDEEYLLLSFHVSEWDAWHD